MDECGECGGDGIADGACDCDGNQLDALGMCGAIALQTPMLMGSATARMIAWAITMNAELATGRVRYSNAVATIFFG